MNIYARGPVILLLFGFGHKFTYQIVICAAARTSGRVEPSAVYKKIQIMLAILAGAPCNLARGSVIITQFEKAAALRGKNIAYGNR